ncbi:MAG: HlyC/CorC family transporter, partial [Bacteroidota bacterium]|nr:HlyC/CorC family transporter [Bacteroidota bacterium]
MSDVGISVSITIIVLLMCSAFFSGAEVALFSLQASAREELSTTKPAGWKYVLRLLRTPHHLLITILVGNTFVNTAIAVIAALVTAHIAAQFGWNQTLSFTIEVIAVTFIVIVVSEVTPKIIAARTPTSAARKIALPLYLVSLLLYPVVVLLVGFIRTVERNVPLSRQADPLTGEDVKILADVVSEDGEINEEERKIIHRMVDAKGMIVREIMTSRPGMVALDAAKTSLDDIVTFFAAQQHSRIPLYRGSVDAIIGILYAKDVIPFLSSPREFPAGKKNADILRLCREAYFIPENKSVEALLEDFQEKKTHVAIVVDEYGRTSGIVTFHDVIRAVVGSGGEEQRADSEREK